MTFLVVTALALLLSLFPTISAAPSADLEYPNTTLTKLAFGSCHKKKYVNVTAPTIWESISAEKPQAFVWTGDSIYPPKRGIASVPLLQEEYFEMKSNVSLGYASFRLSLQSTNIHGTWDDHDYGGNDLGVEMPNKDARAVAFLQFLDKLILFKKNNRNGVYSSVDWGVAPRKVRMILLDTRWHREPHCIPSVAHSLPMGAAISCITRWLTAGLLLSNVFESCRQPRTILGEEQWTWLESQLHESDAQIHIIVSSIQVLTSNPVMESWGHYPEERQRLLKLLRHKSGVVLLSGDVHHAELLAPLPKSNNKTTFVEVTSSGLTHTCATPMYGRVLCRPLLETFDAHRLSKENFYIGKNFGTLEVDWERESFQVFVHDKNGSIVLRTGPMPFQQDVLTGKEIQDITPVNDGHLIPKFLKLLLALQTLVGCLVIPRLLRKRR